MVGVAAAAPATYLAELFDADSATATGKELTAMTIYSWSKLYHTPATTLVEPGAMGPFEQMAHDCIESVAEYQAITDAEKPLQTEKFLKADPTETEPWRGVMLRNTPGQAPAGAPVLIAQGTADTTVRPRSLRGASLQAGSAARPHVAQRGQPHLRGERQRKTDARLDRRPLQRRARAVELPLGPWPANS